MEQVNLSDKKKDIVRDLQFATNTYLKPGTSDEETALAVPNFILN
jgi:hypothetical protein